MPYLIPSRINPFGQFAQLFLFVILTFPTVAKGETWTDSKFISPAEPVILATNTSGDDDLLADDGALDNDLLDFDDPEESEEKVSDEPVKGSAAAHLSLFAENRYPSANTCKVCHSKHYKEWSVSQHAYAQLSPVYMAMQNTINSLTSRTNGDFCIRCHNQVGMNMGESTFISNLERHPTSREGITCVVCHRINNEYGKVSGRVALEQGDLLTPIYGPTGSQELERVLANTDKYRVVTKAEEKGRKIHTDVGHFPQLSTSGFCAICHDVNLYNGFRLEEAFSEYKNSPAADRKVSCQDCHMASVQGLESDYEHGPAAVVGGVPSKERKITNHFFAGPDYPLIHPGIFPHNADAVAMATLAEWLEFDHEAGWGTDEFEDDAAEDYQFPDRWRSIDDRYDAREILEQQFKLLGWAEERRLEVLRNGYKLGAVETQYAGSKGIKFRVEVRNATDGHNVPTGFDAERLVWLEITIRDSTGKLVFQSGDLDPNGDVRDSHSLYVHDGELPLDKQLFSLQSRFLTRNVRGGEREQVLAVNYSNDPLPFVRPFTRSVMLTGQPAGARKHRQTIPPLTSRWAKYKIATKLLTGSGDYHVSIRLKSAAVPVNLIDAIKDVGFDYGMSAKQIADRIVQGHIVVWEKEVTINVQ
jgi:nitrate/TMAO reductase-like tetraheme cytochrome c subunit